VLPTPDDVKAPGKFSGAELLETLFCVFCGPWLASLSRAQRFGVHMKPPSRLTVS
jgi:hypothetical protein